MIGIRRSAAALVNGFAAIGMMALTPDGRNRRPPPNQTTGS
jgi:hypothetical protein